MFKRLLVPLDGSNKSSTVVPYALELAGRLECAVDLLLVEPTAGARLPHPDHHYPQPKINSGESGALVVSTNAASYIREANERYVQRHVEEFEAKAIPATGVVVCGEVVEEILRAALDMRSDAIAMATRKLSNYARKQTGSIAEEVLWRSKLPVILIAQD